VTLPLPEPDPETVIQLPVADADQEQPACVVTPMVPVVAAAAIISDDGESVYVQPTPCVTVNVVPAIVIVPVRAAPVFATTLNDTDPLPAPDAPLVTVIQLLLLTAVQLHQSAAVTVVVPGPPAAVKVWLADEIVGAHGPPCRTLTIVPPMVSDPSRLQVVVLAATSKVTEPLPDPRAPLVTVIHALLLTAVHGHPAAEVTALLTVVAAAVTD
jgi:hypothetical protein